MEQNILIRPGLIADAPGIARVHVDSWRATYAGIVPDDYLAGLSYEKREKWWQEVLSEADSPEFVCVAENKEREIIGFASGGPERSGNSTYKGELYAIYLVQKYHCQGIGRQLTLAVVERLLIEGFSSMLVWVLEKNPFRAFYEALGGRQVYEKEVTFGEARLVEVAYGWQNISRLAEKCRAKERI